VNILALAIGFLFIMVTLYTMVLQRTREIAILKASGASNAFIVRQVLIESLLLTGMGFVVGVGLSLLAAVGIERFAPYLTVQITPEWVLWALAAALAGALVSAVYPAYRASRVDMLSALTYE
jgi:putative ABC transport system permease protein